jgi:1,2-dihydroxy-3-keto-5-methylthiopentene dioxygenase
MPVLAVFDAQGSWRDTHVCDGWITDHLAGQGVSWGRGKKKGQQVLDSAGLFYLPVADGYLGLLVEAGEWVSVPADAPHFFDAGEAGVFRWLAGFVAVVRGLRRGSAVDDGQRRRRRVERRVAPSLSGGGRKKKPALRAPCCSFPLWGKAGMGARRRLQKLVHARRPRAPTPALPRKGRQQLWIVRFGAQPVWDWTDYRPRRFAPDLPPRRSQTAAAPT